MNETGKVMRRIWFGEENRFSLGSVSFEVKDGHPGKNDEQGVRSTSGGSHEAKLR